jgi:predicted phage terminase large subunit-like protein
MSADAHDQNVIAAQWSPAALGWVATRNEPRPYRPTQFHLLMAKSMIDLEQNRLDALFMSIPVRHGKTRLGSNLMPAWFLGLHPSREVLAASHSAEFAADYLGSPTRDFLQRHGPRFFGVSTSASVAARSHWKTNAGGGMTSVGVQQGIAGRGSDLGIIDDPYPNLELAMSRRQRDKAWDWYQAEFITRCAPKAPQIHIMSRWNVDDHMARAIAQAKEAKLRWRHLDFPALAICSECGDYGVNEINECRHGTLDELGRLPGEALWPQERNRDFLLQQRTLVTPRFFDALYQGRPRPDAGAIFQRHWFRYFTVDDNRYYLRGPDGAVTQTYLRNACLRFITVDLATGNSKDGGDFTVFGVFALTPQYELLVLDWFRQRIDGTQQIPMLRHYWNKHRVQRIGVEAVAFQFVFVQQARAAGLPIKAITRSRGETKEIRAFVVAARYEAHQVFHLQGAPWAQPLEDELIDFPVGAHDDQVDVMSDAGSAVAEAMHRSTPQGIYVP